MRLFLLSHNFLQARSIPTAWFGLFFPESCNNVVTGTGNKLAKRPPDSIELLTQLGTKKPNVPFSETNEIFDILKIIDRTIVICVALI